MWIDQKDEIKYGIYGAQSEHFGKVYGRVSDGPKSLDTWIGCREVFHRENRHLKRFYYCHTLPKGCGRSISVFFDKIESKLNLSPGDCSRFGPTNKRKILWVEPSEWWRCHSMRRSLFTALLRQSSVYRIHLDNFDKAIYQGDYLENTREAVDRFLAGYTYYWGGYQGWVRAFDLDEWRNPAAETDVVKLLRDYPKPVPPRRKRKKKKIMNRGW